MTSAQELKKKSDETQLEWLNRLNALYEDHLKRKEAVSQFNAGGEIKDAGPAAIEEGRTQDRNIQDRQEKDKTGSGQTDWAALSEIDALREILANPAGDVDLVAVRTKLGNLRQLENIRYSLSRPKRMPG